MSEEKSEEKKGLVPYSDNHIMRVSQELYEVGKMRWKLSTHGFRLLYAIAIASDQTDNLGIEFPEIVFEKSEIIKWLGLESNKDWNAALMKALEEVRKEGLQRSVTKPNGKKIWYGYSWFSSWFVEEDSNRVAIRLNSDVRPFLRNLKRYAQLQPKHYLCLSTEYQNWFYPYLKNAVKLGKWVVSIDDLKEALYLEKTPSYNPKENKNATENFLKRVIGIKVSKKAKEENQLAKAQKRKPRLLEWDYTKESGKPCGTLWAINEYTDLNVTASVEKEGRSYKRIHFFLSLKGKTKRDKSNAQVVLNAQSHIDQDMQRQQNRNSRVGSKVIGDLFPNIPVEVPNPAHEKTPRSYICYTTEQLESQYKFMGMKSVQELAKVMHLKQGKDGKWYR